MSANATFTQLILATSRLASLSICKAASDTLSKHLLQKFGPEVPEDTAAWKNELRAYIHSILLKVKEPGLSSNVVSKDQLDLALAAITSEGDAAVQTKVIDVISAFDMPRFHYDTVRRTFHLVQNERSKFGVAEEKAEMLRSRYEVMLQRLQRMKMFSPQSSHAVARKKRDEGQMDDGEEDGEDEHTEIVTIESLLGQVGTKCIFGQLAQLTEGIYSLEDVHSHITLNLNSAHLKLSAGLFTEGCMVLVEGETHGDGAFHAATIISPPAEPRAATINAFPQLDWLESDLATKDTRNPEQAMKARLLASPEHANDMIVMLSDVHLDKPAVLSKLQVLLEGLSGSVPPAFVFCGNFTSKPFSSQPGEKDRLKAAFDQLADLLGKFPTLVRESHFVFIPGPGDLPLSMGSCLPCPSLPSVFTAKLREKLPHVTFASNPCRLSWITKELVFYREDLLHKMRRNCIRPPSEVETTDISQHLVKTIVDQGHLAPLTMEKRPVYWNFDHALRLYPLPDVLVLADCVDQYEWPYEGVRALNPGTFAHDYSFVVYFPAQDKAEFSRC